MSNGSDQDTAMKINLVTMHLHKFFWTQDPSSAPSFAGECRLHRPCCVLPWACAAINTLWSCQVIYAGAKDVRTFKYSNWPAFEVCVPV